MPISNSMYEVFVMSYVANFSIIIIDFDTKMSYNPERNMISSPADASAA